MMDSESASSSSSAAATVAVATDASSDGSNNNNKNDNDSSGCYRVLIEFAVRHLDFQLAELESVLDMHGIALVRTHGKAAKEGIPHNNGCHEYPHVCHLVPLPNEDERQNGEQLDSPPVTEEQAVKNKANRQSSRRPFVILSLPFDSPFVPTSAKTKILDCPEKSEPSTTGNGIIGQQHQHHLYEQKEDIASIILSRCTLVRSVLELWGAGATVDDCANVTFDWIQTTPTTATSNVETPKRFVSVGSTVFHNNSHPWQSWKLTVHTLGSKYTRQEQDEMRALFTDRLQWPGPVQMVKPFNEFVLIHEVPLDEAGGPLFPRRHHCVNATSNNDNNDNSMVAIPENDIRPPLACYFGRALRGGRSFQRMGGKMQYYSLKQRTYLGPTSMDAELSFIMNNLGQVRAGHTVFDPFVGTGSILLTCALRGAYCFGTDIDIRVLRGKSAHVNIWTNFKQYGLPRPELVRSDNAIYHRHFRCHTTETAAVATAGIPPPRMLYDAILCDPPYGIRAGARKSGSKREHVAPVRPENRHDHIAQTQIYAVSDVMADLVDLAARTLVSDGRLVYMIPSFASDFDVENDLPRHPCLELVHVCYQPLSAELGRRVVVMKRTAHIPYDPAQRLKYLAAVWKNGHVSAEKCANIRDKLQEAAKQKPRYEERAAIRKEKRRQHKHEKKEAKKKQATMEQRATGLGSGVSKE